MKPVLLFQYGKLKKRKAFDLVFLLSELYGMSKSEVKIKLREGSFRVMITELK